MKRVLSLLVLLLISFPLVGAQEINQNVILTSEQTNIYLDFDANSHYIILYSFQNIHENKSIKIPRSSFVLNRVYRWDRIQEFKNLKAYDEHGSLEIELYERDNEIEFKIYSPSQNINLFPHIIQSFTVEFDIENQLRKDDKNLSYVLSTGPFIPAQVGDYNLNIYLPETFLHSSRLVGIVPLPNSFSKFGSEPNLISFSREDLQKTNYVVHLRFEKIINKDTVYGIILVFIGGLLSILTTFIVDFLKRRDTEAGN